MFRTAERKYKFSVSEKYSIECIPDGIFNFNELDKLAHFWLFLKQLGERSLHPVTKKLGWVSGIMASARKKKSKSTRWQMEHHSASPTPFMQASTLYVHS